MKMMSTLPSFVKLIQAFQLTVELVQFVYQIMSLIRKEMT